MISIQLQFQPNFRKKCLFSELISLLVRKRTKNDQEMEASTSNLSVSEAKWSRVHFFNSFFFLNFLIFPDEAGSPISN